jgi:hypothetical protein
MVEVAVLQAGRVAGSRPDEVNAFFLNLPNPSGLTRPCGLLKWVPEDISWDKARPVRKADNLAAVCELIV